MALLQVQEEVQYIKKDSLLTDFDRTKSSVTPGPHMIVPEAAGKERYDSLNCHVCVL